jgi:hypothetical protein
MLSLEHHCIVYLRLSLLLTLDANSEPPWNSEVTTYITGFVSQALGGDRISFGWMWGVRWDSRVFLHIFSWNEATETLCAVRKEWPTVRKLIEQCKIAVFQIDILLIWTKGVPVTQSLESISSRLAFFISHKYIDEDQSRNNIATYLSNVTG